MTLNTEPTVFIVDDNEAMCQSLRWLLESFGLRVETYNCAQTFLKSFNPAQRGCLIVDIRMPGLSGFELQEQLIQRHNRMPIIFITAHGDVPMAVKAIKAGAMDFITKPFKDQQLLEMVQNALAKDVKRHDDNSLAEIAARITSLTPRERQIMDHVVIGKLNKQIAYELGISVKTVELHRAHVMQKMRVKSLAELVKIHLLINNTPTTL